MCSSDLGNPSVTSLATTDWRSFVFRTVGQTCSSKLLMRGADESVCPVRRGALKGQLRLWKREEDYGWEDSSRRTSFTFAMSATS